MWLLYAIESETIFQTSCYPTAGRMEQIENIQTSCYPTAGRMEQIENKEAIVVTKYKIVRHIDWLDIHGKQNCQVLATLSVNCTIAAVYSCTKIFQAVHGYQVGRRTY